VLALQAVDAPYEAAAAARNKLLPVHAAEGGAPAAAGAPAAPSDATAVAPSHTAATVWAADVASGEHLQAGSEASKRLMESVSRAVAACALWGAYQEFNALEAAHPVALADLSGLDDRMQAEQANLATALDAAALFALATERILAAAPLRRAKLLQPDPEPMQVTPSRAGTPPTRAMVRGRPSSTAATAVSIRVPSVAVRR
jgi:hypothetical protein